MLKHYDLTWEGDAVGTCFARPQPMARGKAQSTECSRHHYHWRRTISLDPSKTHDPCSFNR